MLCTCGGTLQHKSGFSSKNGRPYAFWSCDRFPRCKNSLTEAEYKTLEASGVKELRKQDEKAARTWTDPKHRAYLPKQRSNPNMSATVARRRLTDEQESVIAQIMLPGTHFVRVNADAGTGKSTLATQIAARTIMLPGERTSGIVISFGKKASVEMEGKLPAHWASATVHSIGNDAVAAAYGVQKRNPNDYKTKDILRAEYGDADQPERKALYSVVEDLVDMCKALVYTEDTPEDTILESAVYYNTSVGDSPIEAVIMTRQILKVGSTRDGIVRFGHDYGDMVYLPIRNNLPVSQYRYVIGDEWQDSSPARMQLARKMLRPDSSFLFVGDSLQAIFGFTYADTKAMETCAALFPHVLDFGLTVNWRCPEMVIRLARILCPTIKARPNAPLGAVHEIGDEDFYRIVMPGDLVLCRVNADLIHAAYELIKQGVGAVVLGRDIGTNLKNIIKKLGHTADGYLPTVKFLHRLNEWYAAEEELINSKNLRNPDKALMTLDDNYQCILALCGVEVSESNTVSNIGIPSIERVLDKIDEMFGEETDKGFDPKNVVTLATVHKMKGGQCGRVFVLRAAENHPHPMAESDWEIDGEKCVANVAVTRAGDGTDAPGQALFFVGGMPHWYRDFGGAELITPYEGDMR